MSDNKAWQKIIKVENSVGLKLAHDITEVEQGQFKRVAFKKGHKVKKQDICRLLKLGKRHLYVLDLDSSKVHEDQAVLEIVQALSGPGINFGTVPREGKLELFAKHDGLLKIDVNALIEFNLIPDIMCASIHTNTPVKKNQKLAGTRAIPLAIDRSVLDSALEVAKRNFPVFEVKPYKKTRVRLIVTGSEVFSGLIQDKFKPIVKEKIEALGSELVETSILPDDRELLTEKLKAYLSTDTELIITTGGMSVDPDDVTRFAIKDAGADNLFYSTSVLPGAMLLLAYKNSIPVVGIPACALYHKTTVFDLILPRLLAGEQPDNTDLAKLAHGGLCLDCRSCSYPSCSFGKT